MATEKAGVEITLRIREVLGSNPCWDTGYHE
jgi:hypothetical protein